MSKATIIEFEGDKIVERVVKRHEVIISFILLIYYYFINYYLLLTIIYSYIFYKNKIDSSR